jgi:LacI family transcriptional regulator
VEAVPPPSRDPARARIADVARLAGVGVGTVSRVLNGSPLVSDVTRATVLATIDALDYRPSRHGRRLSLGRTLTLGVVVPFFTSPSVVQRMEGFVTGIAGSRYDLALFNVTTTGERDRHLADLARGDRADGILLVTLRPTDAEVEAFAAAGVTAVLVDVAHPALSHVVIDDVEGGFIATRYLLDLGHRRIGFVGGPPAKPNPFGFVSSPRRRMGYRQALDEAGVDLSLEYVREGTYGRHVAHRLTAELLRLPEPPTAIFAVSDTMALGVLEAAGRAGLAVPGELSVVGFDDIEVASYVGLTTVRQPLAESGLRGAELLLAALDGPPPVPSADVLPLELIVRRTTAPPLT